MRLAFPIVRKTKIIATLGPKSMSPQMISGLQKVGVSVFRLNCSHLATDALGTAIRDVRTNAPTAAVLVDIRGPKLRYAGPERKLQKGAKVMFGLAELGLEGIAGSLTRGLVVGERVLLDDGRIETRVGAVEAGNVEVTVVAGGTLRLGKGVNLPDTVVEGSVLSEKDHADLIVARESGSDIVAVSFVQRASDVEEVRSLLAPGQLVFAKIERPQALAQIESICAVSDGVMAARGDLGVELPYEQVPSAQRQIALAALRSGTISICATEMLESMTTSNRPTRAEVSDVTAAVRDGFDAVMLSGETAVGADPVGAVRAMARIAESAEAEVSMPNWFADANPEKAAVTAAAAALAKRINADRIVSITNTGYSALLLAACRPSCPIVAVTPRPEVARWLAAARGVSAVVVERDSEISRTIAEGIASARDAGMVDAGERLVICASRLGPNSDADTILLHLEP